MERAQPVSRARDGPDPAPLGRREGGAAALDHRHFPAPHGGHLPGGGDPAICRPPPREAPQAWLRRCGSHWSLPPTPHTLPEQQRRTRTTIPRPPAPAALGGLGVTGVGRRPPRRCPGRAVAAATQLQVRGKPRPRQPIDFATCATHNRATPTSSSSATSPVSTAGAFSGHVLGVVDDRLLKPLFGFEVPVGRLSRARRQVPEYLARGRLLQGPWTNPYTDETSPRAARAERTPEGFRRHQPGAAVPARLFRFRFGNGRTQAFILPRMVDRAGDWASCM